MEPSCGTCEYGDDFFLPFPPSSETEAPLSIDFSPECDGYTEDSISLYSDSRSLHSCPISHQESSSSFGSTESDDSNTSHSDDSDPSVDVRITFNSEKVRQLNDITQACTLRCQQRKALRRVMQALRENVRPKPKPIDFTSLLIRKMLKARSNARLHSFEFPVLS
jgi:hypothetical protein